MMQAGSFEEEELGEFSTDLKAENAGLKTEVAELKRLLARHNNDNKLEASPDKDLEEGAPMRSPTSRALLGTANQGSNGKALPLTHCAHSLRKAAEKRMHGATWYGAGKNLNKSCDFREAKTCTLTKTATFRVVRRKEGEPFMNSLVGVVATANTECDIVKRWGQKPFNAFQPSKKRGKRALKDPLIIDLSFRKQLTGVRKCYCEEEATERSSATRVLLGRSRGKPKKPTPASSGYSSTSGYGYKSGYGSKSGYDSKSSEACDKCKWVWTVKKTCSVQSDVWSVQQKFCNSANKKILCNAKGTPDLLHDSAMGTACTLF